MVVLRKQSGLFPRLGEYSNVGSESGKGKRTLLGTSVRHLKPSVVSGTLQPKLQVPRAGVFLQVVLAPRMCRLEVWVTALSHVEAHSHTL